MDYTIREIRKSEYLLLADFLYEAVFLPEGMDPPPKSIVASPELQVYIERFGELKDDQCLVAEVNGSVIGAVWVRIMNDYGHVDRKTPSLAISIYEEYRGSGIGTAMMTSMIARLKKSGYEKVSLSVQKSNYAARMYEKLGFEIVSENSEEYIMVKQL